MLNYKTAPICLLAIALLTIPHDSKASSSPGAARIDGRIYTLEELAKQDQGRLFDIESKKYELVRNLSAQKYLDGYFQKLANSKRVSPEQARADYMEPRTKPSEQEIKEASLQFKDHPQLKALNDSERKREISEYLRQTKARDVLAALIAEAEGSKKLDILFPEPKEPIYDVQVSKDDHVRYKLGYEKDDPPCEGEACAITIVEYSDFQCPFCSQVQDASRKVLKEYGGKVRWVVRDYLLPFHERARPAAIAAHCAAEQGKYWAMYDALFKNQRNLDDAAIKKYATELGLDGKAFDACRAHPDKAVARIALNAKSAESLGVSGTPTFFINGRRMSGKLPFEEFKKAIESSLKN